MSKKMVEAEVRKAPGEDLEQDHETLYVFVAALHRSYASIYITMMYFFSLVARAQSLLGSMFSIFSHMVFVFQVESRILHCEISERIVVHRYQGNSYLDSTVIVGWIPFASKIKWLLTAELE